jgi:hypothetical protein
MIDVDIISGAQGNLMGIVKATGQLRHHFWGEYLATIYLHFSDKDCAADALNVLKGAWEPSVQNNILIWEGNSKELEACKDQLEKYGADKKKIDSVQFSIDHGEKFEVVIPVTPVEQLAFDWEIK